MRAYTRNDEIALPEIEERGVREVEEELEGHEVAHALVRVERVERVCEVCSVWS